MSEYPTDPTIDPTVAATPAGSAPTHQQRDAAALVALTAMRTWRDRCVAEIADLAEATGLQGTGVLATFYPRVDLDEGEHGAWREDLIGVQFTSDTDRVDLEPDGSVLWEQCVAAWLSLRESLGHLHQAACPPGLAVEPGPGTIALWEPFYCPDFDPYPEAVLIPEPPVDADPFELLLRDIDAEITEAEDRLLTLMTDRDLRPPTIPGHEPGDCMS